MAVTRNFRFPLIDPNDKFNGSSHINELAREIDHVLQHVEEVGKDSHYVLPPATKTRLGGVIAGDNVDIAQDGTISVNVNPYELPPASYTTLGGVIVDKKGGLKLDPNGTLHIDDKTLGIPDGSITTDKIADKAVTTPKVADEAITYEKLSSSMKSSIDAANHIAEGNPNNIQVDTTVKSEYITSLNVSIKEIGGFHFFEADFDLNANGSDSYWNICKNPYNDLNLDKYYGLVCICGTAKNKENSKVYPVKLSYYNYGEPYFAVSTANSINQNSGLTLPSGNYEVEMSSMFFHSSN